MDYRFLTLPTRPHASNHSLARSPDRVTPPAGGLASRASMGILCAVAAWLCSGAALAAPTPDVIDRIAANYPDGLPRYMTPEEQLLPFQGPTRAEYDLRSPPTGQQIYCPPEYAPQDGMFIAWETEYNLLTDLTVGVTTGDPDAIVYVVVDTASEQTSATNMLQAAGADMTQVQFIIRTTDSVWIRDYGPRFIFEDGTRAIIDHTYNRPRPNDNLLNDYISSLWGEPQYDIPLTHGGGNFHLFSNGDAFMSSLILAENPGLSEQDIKDLYLEYQNVNVTIYTGFPTSFDATRHIDMWMMPLGDYLVIIGQYDPGTGQPYTITENAVADLVSRGYTVYRTPGWQAGGTHYTYTNAVILNNLVFVPQFGSPYTSEDATALAVFQAALPTHTIIGVDCASIIPLAGAAHCIVMHVPSYPPAGLDVTPLDDFNPAGDAGGPFTPGSIVYTLENTSDNAITYNVTKTQAWVSLTNAPGSIPAHDTTTVTVSINAVADALDYGFYSDTINFINTTDHVGDTTRQVTLSVVAPPPQITTASLPDGATEVPYGPVQFEASGGQPPVVWSLVTELDYTEEGLGQSDFGTTGTAQHWHGDDTRWDYTLPFSFPFYGESYTDIRVWSNGFIDFGSFSGSSAQNSTANLIANKMIAPIWDDLKTSGTGNDVFIDESVPGDVTIRWKAITYVGAYPVNMSVTLTEDGVIRMHYGDGNTSLTPTVGISSGDGVHYTLSIYNGAGTLTNAESMQFAFPRTLPQGLTFGPGGSLSGTPAEFGSFEPVFKITDDLGRTDEAMISLFVADFAPGDCDGDDDGDVDLEDFAGFQLCFTGEGQGPAATGCEMFYGDPDDDVDLDDYTAFASGLTGP